MSFICTLWGHKGRWSPWLKTYYCRWCHEEVTPKYR
jgi:hypothetical protein